ncbi:PREDICTED: activin receptor type-2A-like [Priapulus caudatus]|uniref:Serine/threonine-protein kinase receptor n=1 Tax=Priapulus caudatus TaxID=37621 RepID=A0ABM1EQD9_PRICU|nr:PREDICTED: activin receptor type-2A-like [Priapulus caudatus]
MGNETETCYACQKSDDRGCVADVRVCEKARFTHCYVWYLKSAGKINVGAMDCMSNHAGRPDCPSKHCTEAGCFHCCKGNNCNGILLDRLLAAEEEQSRLSHAETTTLPSTVGLASSTSNVRVTSSAYTDGVGQRLQNPGYVYALSAFLLLGIFLIAVSSFYRLRRNKGGGGGTVALPNVGASFDGLCGGRGDIRLIAMVSQGRYGAVFKARMGEEYVAVKLFPLHDRNSWTQELNIFRLPQMSHANVVRFVGVHSCCYNQQTELWLVTSFYEIGSLGDYLKKHTVTLLEYCKIVETMSAGLAYLHEELPGGATYRCKPSIAHRDFKSTNVLLKNDLTACIADFGLAMVFRDERPIGNMHARVGTFRYMAPELLEGSICFQQDAFLRIDMYAFALVMWETMARCTASQESVGEYSLPYQKEAGLQPSFVDLRKIVVLQNVRPDIKEAWRKHIELGRVVTTVEECWDSEPEARLSASCVGERIAELRELCVERRRGRPNDPAVTSRPEAATSRPDPLVTSRSDPAVTSRPDPAITLRPEAATSRPDPAVTSRPESASQPMPA